jgi:hypothetical protein
VIGLLPIGRVPAQCGDDALSPCLVVCAWLPGLEVQQVEAHRPENGDYEGCAREASARWPEEPSSGCCVETVVWQCNTVGNSVGRVLTDGTNVPNHRRETKRVDAQHSQSDWLSKRTYHKLVVPLELDEDRWLCPLSKTQTGVVLVWARSFK